MFNQKRKKMNKSITDQKERYEDFLNEVYDLTKLGAVNNLSTIVEKYGISQSLVSFLRHKAILVPLSNSHRYPQWMMDRKEHFTTSEVDMLITEYRVWKKKQEKNNFIKDNVVIPEGFKRSLLSVSDKDLMKELRNRGYSGTLTIKREVKI